MTAQLPPPIDSPTTDLSLNVLVDSTDSTADPTTLRQEVMVALGRRAIAPPDLSVLLQDAAALAAKSLSADCFGVAEMQPNGTQMTFRFGRTESPSMPESTEEYEIETADARTLSGYVLSVAQPVVVADLEKDERITDRRLVQRGVASAVVCPLMHIDHSFGSLGVYSTEPREFTRQDLLFVESIAHLITTTMARQWAEQSLAEQKQYSAAVIETIEAPVLVLTCDGRIKQLNRACQDIMGFALEEVKNRQVWGAFLLPEEMPTVRAAFERLCRGETPTRFESFVLTKHGQRRRISWSYTVLKNNDGKIESLVGTGIDVTEQHAALERLEKVEAEASLTKQSLDELKEKIELHEIVFDNDGNLCSGANQERRQRHRRPYPYSQFIAPMSGDKLPDRRSFRGVRCRDISARGFSFFSSDKPDYDKIVVAFGSHPTVIYLVAEIVHNTPTIYDEQDAFLVGCQYAGKATY